MTFFLPEAAPDELPPARGTDKAIPTFWQGLGAYWTEASITRNANFRAQNTDESVRGDRVARIVDTLGEEEALARVRGAGLNVDQISPDRLPDFLRFNPRAQQAILNSVQGQDDRLGFDVTPEGIEAEATSRLEREYQDAQDMIALTGGGATQPLLGSLMGGVADVRNLPFLIGGLGSTAGKSFLSVVGREAALNVATEAAFLPSQFEMAERLGIEDPSVLATLRDAAIIGGAFGGLAEGVTRGLTYYRGTRAKPTPLHPATTQALVDRAEEALTRAADPIPETVTAVREAVAERRAAAMEARPPLILRAEDRVAPANADQTTNPLAAPDNVAPAPSAEPAAANNFEPDAEALRVYEDSRTAILRDYPELRPTRAGERRTLSAWIKGRGGVEWFQPTPEGGRVKTWIAQELENRGVSQRQALGIQKKGGSRDLDNLDDGEGGDSARLFGTDDTGTYLNREAIADALAREISTGKSEPTTLSMRTAMDDLARLERDTFEPPRPAQDRFLDGESVADGFMVRVGDYAGDGKLLGRDLDAFLGLRYPGVRFTDSERREMLEALAESGGDADLLVERILEREAEFFNAPAEAVYDPIPGWDDPPAAAAPAAGRGEGPGGPDEAAGAARLGGEGQGGDPLASERTAAGEQTLLPGVAPITDRARLEARMGKPLAGAVRAADEGLFDLGARSQMDWLDEPGGAKAAPIQDARTADLRREVTVAPEPEPVAPARFANMQPETLRRLAADLEASVPAWMESGNPVDAETGAMLGKKAELARLLAGLTDEEFARVEATVGKGRLNDLHPGNTRQPETGLQEVRAALAKMDSDPNAPIPAFAAESKQRGRDSAMRQERIVASMTPSRQAIFADFPKEATDVPGADEMTYYAARDGALAQLSGTTELKPKSRNMLAGYKAGQEWARSQMDRPVTFFGSDGEQRTMSLSAALDDLDMGDAFAQAITVCGMRSPAP